MAPRAFLTLRLFPLVAALVTWAALLAWADLNMTPATFRSVREADVIGSWDDDLTHVSHMVLNLPHLTVPTVAVFGASAIREALPAPPDMERLLRGSVRTDVGYLQLATAGQTLTETLTLFDAVDLPRGSLAVVQLTHLRVVAEPDEAGDELASRRLPLITDTATARLVRAEGGAVVWMPSLLRHRAWLAMVARGRFRPDAAACLANLKGLRFTRRCPWPALEWPWWASPGAYRDFHYPRRSLPAQVKDSLVRLAGYQARVRSASSAEFSVRIVRTLLDHARARGIDVLLVRLPRDPRVREAESRFEPHFVAVKTAARDYDVPVIDLSDSLGFVSGDFFDLHHMLAEPRERFGRIFASLVAERWRPTSTRGPRG